MGLECELCQSNVILLFVIYQPCKHKSSQMYLYSTFQSFLSLSPDVVLN